MRQENKNKITYKENLRTQTMCERVYQFLSKVSLLCLAISVEICTHYLVKKNQELISPSPNTTSKNNYDIDKKEIEMEKEREKKEEGRREEALRITAILNHHN